MNNADFWASIRGIIAQGFTLEGLQTLAMQNSLSVGSLYINDFHRSNSVAAQRELRHMSLHPFSREQKILIALVLKGTAESHDYCNDCLYFKQGQCIKDNSGRTNVSKSDHACREYKYDMYGIRFK